MKVLITAAGLGKRSGLNGHIRKEMLPVYDCREGIMVLRPIIEVIMNRYRSYGYRDFVIVLGKDDHRTNSYIHEFYPDVEIAVQKAPSGFGDAVQTASDMISGKFLLNSGDGILISRSDTDRFIDAVRSNRYSIVLGLMEVENPSRYGVASVEMNGGTIEVRGVIEKPANPPSNLALVATYQLEDSIFGELRKMKGDNIELTPAIDSLIRSGLRATAVKVNRKDWLSVGRVQDYMGVLKSSFENSSPCQ